MGFFIGLYFFIAFIVDTLISYNWAMCGFTIQWDAMIIWQAWRWIPMLFFYFKER